MHVAVKVNPTTRQLSSLVTIRLASLTVRRRTYVVEDPVTAEFTTRKGRDREFMDTNAACSTTEYELMQRLREGDAWANHVHAQRMAAASSRRRAASSSSGGGDDAGVEEMEPPSPSRFVLRIELDRKQCEKYAMKPRGVARIVSKHTGLEFCTVQETDALSDIWMVRIRPWYTSGDPKVGERVFLENLKDNLLSSVSIGGMGDIRSAKMSKRTEIVELDDGSLEEQEMDCVVTEGSCLASVARQPWADWRRTVTNDIVQVRETLGIWAAKSVMLQQMHQVLFAQDGYVDQRHIQMLIDAQFRTGMFSKLNGSNISTADTGPWQRCLFEKQFNVFTEAGALGFVDKMDGPTQPMVLGELPPVGTGAFGILCQDIPDMIKPLKAASKFGHLLSKRDKEDITRESAGTGFKQGVDEDGYYRTVGAGVLRRGKPVLLPAAAFDPVVMPSIEEDAAGDVVEQEGISAAEGEEGAFHPSSP